MKKQFFTLLALTIALTPPAQAMENRDKVRKLDKKYNSWLYKAECNELVTKINKQELDQIEVLHNRWKKINEKPSICKQKEIRSFWNEKIPNQYLGYTYFSLGSREDINNLYQYFWRYSDNRPKIKDILGSDVANASSYELFQSNTIKKLDLLVYHILTTPQEISEDFRRQLLSTLLNHEGTRLFISDSILLFLLLYNLEKIQTSPDQLMDGDLKKIIDRLLAHKDLLRDLMKFRESVKTKFEDLLNLTCIRGTAKVQKLRREILKTIRRLKHNQS